MFISDEQEAQSEVMHSLRIILSFKILRERLFSENQHEHEDNLLQIGSFLLNIYISCLKMLNKSQSEVLINLNILRIEMFSENQDSSGLVTLIKNILTCFHVCWNFLCLQLNEPEESHPGVKRWR